MRTLAYLVLLAGPGLASNKTDNQMRNSSNISVLQKLDTL